MQVEVFVLFEISALKDGIRSYFGRESVSEGVSYGIRSFGRESVSEGVSLPQN